MSKTENQNMPFSFKRITIAFILSSTCAHATTFNQINLVTDDQTQNSASITDTNLVNPWGISFSSSSPFWLSDNGTGKSTVYNVNPTTNAISKLGISVTIPGNGSVTGQVFNSKSGAFNNDPFIFVSEDGTVSGWRGALGLTGTAETLVAGSDQNVYKGVADATVGNDLYLYAANFKADSIDVIPDSNTAPSLSGSFSDPNLPTGYAPFNIQNLAGNLYVTYALQDAQKHDEIDGLGNGFVDEYDTQGHLIARIASQGSLDSPWGLAIAPSSFGEFANSLLVGNFGDGKINAYDPISHIFLGQLTGTTGQALAIDGLWGLATGNNASSGSNQKLYFTAGPNSESNGLFGVISPAPVPVPASIWLFGSTLFGLIFAGKSKMVKFSA